MQVILRVLLYLGFALSPVYLFKRGLPQIADFILLALVGFLLLDRIQYKSSGNRESLPIIWLGLCVWICFVNLVLSLYYQSYKFLFVSPYYIYNTAIGAALYYYLQRYPGSLIDVYRAICCGLIISGVGVIFGFGSGTRATGFFNNPNQLGYFSLLGLGSLVVFSQMNIRSGTLGLVATLSGIIGILAAASLAALAGALMIAFAYAGSILKFKSLLRSLIGVLLIGVVYVASQETSLVKTIEGTLTVRAERFENKVESVYEERAYERITHFPQFIIFGAGEAYRERFYPYDVNEIHSSFGTLLFSYGLMGISLFLGLLVVISYRAGLVCAIVLSGIAAYSFTHMGLRTTSFWILLVLMLYSAKMKKSQLNYNAL